MILLGIAAAMVLWAAASAATARGGVPGTLAALAAGGLLLFGAFRWVRSSRERVDPASREAHERRWLARLVAAGFLVRVAVSTVLHETDLWSFLGPDELTFDQNARVNALWLKGDVPYMLGYRFLGSHEVGYFLLVGSMYHAFGILKLFPLLLNCMVGAALAYPVHALAGRLGGRLAARRAALLVVVFPSFVLWSSLMVRDILVLFLIATVLLAAEQLRRRPGIEGILRLLLPLLAVGMLRTYIFLILCAAIGGALLLGRRSVARSLVVGGAVMVVLIVVLQTSGLGQTEMERANLEYLSRMRVYNAMGSTGAGSLGTDVDISTPTAALTYLPTGLVYFFLSPLPWQIGSQRQAMAVADLLLWYSVLPAVVAGLAWLVRRRFRAVLPLLFVVIGISVLYGLVEGNIGIIFRHRAQVIVALCAVAGVGHALKKRAARKESRRLEGSLPLDAPARGALGPSPGLRVPTLAP